MPLGWSKLSHLIDHRPSSNPQLIQRPAPKTGVVEQARITASRSEYSERASFTDPVPHLAQAMADCDIRAVG